MLFELSKSTAFRVFKSLMFSCHNSQERNACILSTPGSRLCISNTSCKHAIRIRVRTWNVTHRRDKLPNERTKLRAASTRIVMPEQVDPIRFSVSPVFLINRRACSIINRLFKPADVLSGFKWQRLRIETLPAFEPADTWAAWQNPTLARSENSSAEICRQCVYLSSSVEYGRKVVVDGVLSTISFSECAQSKTWCRMVFG